MSNTCTNVRLKKGLANECWYPPIFICNPSEEKTTDNGTAEEYRLRSGWVAVFIAHPFLLKVTKERMIIIIIIIYSSAGLRLSCFCVIADVKQSTARSVLERYESYLTNLKLTAVADHIRDIWVI